MNVHEIMYRGDPEYSDMRRVREILNSSGFFSGEEIEVAVELVEERLKKGVSSGYHFLFAGRGEEVIGYSCFGPIPCTIGSYDLYWIALTSSLRGSGLGKDLLHRTEQIIIELAGKRIYAETSSREQYHPTRAFYEACGYIVEAVVKNFYAPGDDKIIYAKALVHPDAFPSYAVSRDTADSDRRP